MLERPLKMVASTILLFGCAIIGFLLLPFLGVIAVAGFACILSLQRLKTILTAILVAN